MAVFGDNNVHLISVSPDFEKMRISTFIVIATNKPVDMRQFDSWLKTKLGDRAKSVLLTGDQVKEFLANRYSVVLRDDYAPVDNLVAPIFEERFGHSRKGS
jgi:hypothetical protein